MGSHSTFDEHRENPEYADSPTFLELCASASTNIVPNMGLDFLSVRDKKCVNVARNIRPGRGN